MLETLSIRNIVLIDELHLEFTPGLCVLTGETGAGKSILLDALGLALGERAETRLLRQGAKQAQVTALFRLPSSHSLWQEIDAQGILYEGQELIFRRVLESDGRAKCFLNDHLISQTLMRRLGQHLVEIHGQFDQLLEAKSHLLALDAFGKINRKPVEEAFNAYKNARQALIDFQDALAKSFERQTFLRFAVEEIEKAAPRPGEEQDLERERALISHRAKLAEALLLVDQTLPPLMSGLSLSHKTFSRIQELLPEKLTPLVEASDRAMVEVQEILEGIKSLKGDVDGSPSSLETLENRLHALRALSRKYHAENLLCRLDEFKKELAALDHGEDHLHDLEVTLQKTKQIYAEKARELSALRRSAAKSLEATLAEEFSPLKLPHVRFRVHFEELSEDMGSERGLDRIEFYIQTNPGTPEGPLSAIASGGELSRLMLALKVVLAAAEDVPTLIFDEIESGTGITHSPQIASQGTQHMVVLKAVTQEGTTTHVKSLLQEERCEEVARMLAGQDITDEARAAARRLMGEV
ncbi:MAG: DNA repair protein RecN [Proteobacteria bacterium]|nr:DNA repair protein RecN [Pseudomonadota bacterium]